MENNRSDKVCKGKQALVKDEESYAERFEAFLAGGFESKKHWPEEKVTPTLLLVLSTTYDDSDQSINILSVGAGKGGGDIFLLEELLKHQSVLRNRKIVYTVIEINRGFITLFQEKVQENSETLKDVEFRWICDSFENVTERDDFTTKFDIIMFCHSLYYMDAEKAMDKCMTNLLKVGGCMFCIVLTDADFTRKIMDKFEHQIREAFVNHRRVSIRELGEMVKEKHWRHESHTREIIFDIQDLFNPDSYRAPLLLDFFFEVKNAKEILGEKGLQEFFTWLQSLRIEERGNKTTEFPILKCNGIMIIFKD